MRMVVAVTDSEEEPSTWFTEQRRVMVVTEEVMSYYGNSVGRWLPQAGGLLVTLPDVANAVDLQGVHTRAVFFVSKTTTDDLSDWSKEETATHTLSLLPPAALYGDQPLLHPLLTSSEGSVLRYRPVGDLPAPPRLDNDIATSIANGDSDAMIQHVARLFSHHEGLTEEVLRFSLSYDWGAVDVCHWHHRLARTTRRLVDQSNQFSAKKGATLADIVLRVAAFIVRLAPPLTVETTESRAKKTAKLSEGDKNEGVTVNELEKYRNYYSTAPDLQLQATLCHLFDRCPPNIIDTLGVAWGLSWVLPGMKATFTKLNKTRHEMVARIRLRYGSKIDPHTGEFLVILAHLLYDTVGEYSLPIERLEERLAWRYTLAVELGDLRSFLTNCFLLSGSNNRQERKDARKAREAVEEEEDPSMVVKPLSSRQTGKVLPRHVVLYQQHEVKVPAPAVFYPLDWKPLPLTEQRSLHVQKMRSIALSEILMAMPPKQKPMHVGSVGNLIGKWSAFNARFDGCLGISLSEFLLQHPEDFLVSGTLVTRRKAGKTEQVRMRFDQDQEDGSDDDEGRKTRDRKSLTGLSNKEKIELPRRAQKKRAIKEFNRSRFNRNHKKSDPSARVPGYVKHGPRRIKGRGKKANIRNYKRGA
ncbi:hypothetical protein, conserved [Angomonas deanei]|uniref:Uncharacterized protein n=1 Tax=Angomonas deanei TaxID=59799 RepID=A0A7G2CS91_9TRYP|nr:hypothetical protein, conserved [Angomonas deanei]